MRKIRNNKNIMLKYGVLALLLILTIGYALLNANLNINGTSIFARTTWDIHFENLVPDTNMTLSQGEGASITQNDTTEVTYTLNFDTPGQYYEFEVDAVNDGTIDGMIDTVTSTIKIGNGTATPITTNPSNLPGYLAYSATYSDGGAIAQYHLLEAGESETYKVRIAFRDDIEANELPESAQSIELTFGVEYVQSDENAVQSHPESTVYTVNIEPYSVLNGQAIPNEITTYQTPALAMAALKAATGGTTDYPFFFKHTLNNDLVEDSYLGFVITADDVTNARNEYIANCNNDQTCIDGYQGMTAGTYYIKRTQTMEYVNDHWSCKSEYGNGIENCLSPDYNANKAVLLGAFGSSHCEEWVGNYFVCSPGDYSQGDLSITASLKYGGHVEGHFGTFYCGNGDNGELCCYYFND